MSGFGLFDYNLLLFYDNFINEPNAGIRDGIGHVRFGEHLIR
jgi:hypothetical protein